MFKIKGFINFIKQRSEEVQSFQHKLKKIELWDFTLLPWLRYRKVQLLLNILDK